MAFRGGQGWRPPQHALAPPTSSTSPRANLEDRAFQVVEGGSQKGSWRCSERRVRAGAAVFGPGRRGLGFSRLPEAPGAKLWRKHHPEGDIQRKSCVLPGLCLLNVVFLSPSPPAPPSSPPPLFLSNRSLFMIAWITEEEIRRLMKERCYTKLMNTSQEEEGLYLE